MSVSAPRGLRGSGLRRLACYRSGGALRRRCRCLGRPGHGRLRACLSRFGLTQGGGICLSSGSHHVLVVCLSDEIIKILSEQLHKSLRAISGDDPRPHTLFQCFSRSAPYLINLARSRRSWRRMYPLRSTGQPHRLSVNPHVRRDQSARNPGRQTDGNQALSTDLLSGGVIAERTGWSQRRMDRSG